VAAGGLIVVLFLAIRASQRASPRVLGVELAVAVLILLIVVGTLRLSRGRSAVEAAVVGLASLLAYASLAL